MCCPSGWSYTLQAPMWVSLGALLRSAGDIAPAGTRRTGARGAKVHNKTRVFLLHAFVGSFGGIARREDGMGVVPCGSACADSLRRAPPGAACTSIVFFKQTCFYKKNSNTKHKPRPPPPRRPSPAPHVSRPLPGPLHTRASRLPVVGAAAAAVRPRESNATWGSLG